MLKLFTHVFSKKQNEKSLTRQRDKTVRNHSARYSKYDDKIIIRHHKLGIAHKETARLLGRTISSTYNRKNKLKRMGLI